MGLARRKVKHTLHLDSEANLVRFGARRALSATAAAAVITADRARSQAQYVSRPYLRYNRRFSADIIDAQLSSAATIAALLWSLAVGGAHLTFARWARIFDHASHYCRYVALASGTPRCLTRTGSAMQLLHQRHHGSGKPPRGARIRARARQVGSPLLSLATRKPLTAALAGGSTFEWWVFGGGAVTCSTEAFVLLLALWLQYSLMGLHIADEDDELVLLWLHEARRCLVAQA